MIYSDLSVQKEIQYQHLEMLIYIFQVYLNDVNKPQYQLNLFCAPVLQK